MLSLNTHESSKQHFLPLCDTTPSTELYISNVVLQYHPIRMDTNIVCVKFLLDCQQCKELCIWVILICVFRRTAVLLLDEIMYMTIIVDVDHLVQWGYSGFREPLQSFSMVTSVWAGQLEFGVWFLDGTKIFLFATSRFAVGITLPPIHCEGLIFSQI